MGYSSLASVKIWSPCHSGKRTHKIDSVAIHTMAGNLSVEECGNLFANSATQASSNYGVDSKGHIGVYVDEDNRAWCTSSNGVDQRAISIEVASINAHEPYECTPDAYQSLIRLLVDICQRNDISGLKWREDKSYAKSAAAGGSVSEQNMFVHRWFANKSCPGDYLYKRMGQIANDVNSRLANGESYGSGEFAGVNLHVDYQEFSPYIVTLNRDSKPNYKSFTTLNMLGALLEAGYRYTSSHRKTDTFDNPNLEAQVKEIDKLQLSYGLYTICRAKDVLQAKEEMYYFSFPIRRHPPAMGVWLVLETGNNKHTNNLLLNRYKQDLIRLGFKNKMGIICNRRMLDYIDWDTYQNDFYLWLVDHVDDVDEFDRLLDPEFFDTDGKG